MWGHSVCVGEQEGAWQPVSGTDRKRFREGDELRPEKPLGDKELSADGVSGVVVSALSLGMFQQQPDPSPWKRVCRVL